MSTAGNAPRAAALIELADRYAAQGLPAAARGALMRAHRASEPGDGPAPRRLAELALAAGDGELARSFAEEAARREPSASARVLLGRCQLEAGNQDAARLSFNTVLETAGRLRLARARAHLGLARVAAIHADRAGSGANAMAALDEVLAHAVEVAERPERIDDDLPLAEEAIKRAVACDRAADVADAVDRFGEAHPTGPHHVVRAIALAVRQARGETSISDRDVEAELGRELEVRPHSRATRLFLVERIMRRRFRDAGARAEAMLHLSRLTDELGEVRPGTPHGDLGAQVALMRAALFEDDPATAAEAEACYREGVRLRPGNAAPMGHLALLALSRGDQEGAMAEIERALRIDGDERNGWRNAARAVFAAGPGPDASLVIERVVEAARSGAGEPVADVATRLVWAVTEIARDEVMAGMHARGHRLKNLLGIIGSRARSARKLAVDEGLATRLRDLEAEVTNLYDEWAAYLRSMQSPSSAIIEIVPVAPLLDEVTRAARDRTSAIVNVSVDDGLPDLRGDRMLLLEALLNVVSNAAEACAAGGGEVSVAARAVRASGASVVEIEVEDTGPGIARADLARIFTPGFTTKESGSGVGLVIAERVVAAHHGRILVDSEEGRGTRVSVMLPSDLGGFGGLASFPGAHRGDAE
ncbi:MAG TPA: ATP-binding protein [Kofleriaceae bacterium]|nr:ATP-binding protein [Kofleriaceae bacterium]